jgi:hypothetical protein
MTRLLSTAAINSPVSGLGGSTEFAWKTGNRRSDCVCLRFLGGAPGEIRTPNLLIRSQMLYPLSYGRLS